MQQGDLLKLVFLSAPHVRMGPQEILCYVYSFVKSRQEKALPRIFYQGYDYVCQKVRPNSFKYWRCSRYIANNCRARAILELDGGLRLNDNHNHAPYGSEEVKHMMFVAKDDALPIVEFLLLMSKGRSDR